MSKLLVLQAILNAHKVFGPSAFTPVLLNLAIIGSAIGFSDQLEDPSFGFILGFLIGGVVQIAFQVPFLLKHTGLSPEHAGPSPKHVRLSPEHAGLSPKCAGGTNMPG